MSVNMKNALILHGTGNDSEDNWFPWLKKELEKRRYKVWVPDLPQAHNPNLERYNKLIFENWEFDEDSIIIGHSSGAFAILGILEKLPKNLVIEKAILVSGFVSDLGFRAINELFLRPLDYSKIKGKVKKFVLIHSDDDPYVPVWHGRVLKEKLGEGAKLVIMSGQKHFSTSTYGGKYRRFIELLEYIN